VYQHARGYKSLPCRREGFPFATFASFAFKRRLTAKDAKGRGAKAAKKITALDAPSR
jgi:hypothetical protein